jgi:hypothetical protein
MEEWSVISNGMRLSVFASILAPSACFCVDRDGAAKGKVRLQARTRKEFRSCFNRSMQNLVPAATRLS